MSIQRVKAKKMRRTELENYEAIEACELREMMLANDDLENARNLNDIAPAIRLLYFIHQWRLEQNESGAQDNG